MQKVMNDYNSRTDKPEERICELKESLEKKNNPNEAWRDEMVNHTSLPRAL